MSITENNGNIFNMDTDNTVNVAIKHKRDYTQEDRARAVALAQSEQNMASAAQALGIPLSTLSEWCRGLYGNIDPLQVAAAKKDQVAALESLTWKAMGYASNPQKMEDASLAQLATLIGVTIDKAQLLRGQPTSISQSSTLTRDQALDRIRQAIQANAIDVLPEKEGGEGVQASGSPGRDTVEREQMEVTSQETVGLLSQGEDVGVT